jgi:hypothetical protein
VDITSYRLIQILPKLELEELVAGIGGKCGSTAIDREFIRRMPNTFGTAFNKLRVEKVGPGSRFMGDFESPKRDFGHAVDLDKKYYINLVMPGVSDSATYEVEESNVVLTR